jgi:stage II sporulation protein D
VSGSLSRALWLLPLFLGVSAHGAPITDRGGRDVSVALFSTLSVRSLTIEPLSANAWVAHCAACVQQPLTRPLQVDIPANIFAGGTLRVTDRATRATRTAAGLWHLRATPDHRAIDVVLTLPSERYVEAVLNAEAASGEPPQSLRALAIVARTYALNGSHFTALAGHLPADLCDSTECQAMRPGNIPPAIVDAAQATAGETLWFSSRRAEAFFSQNCGGTTEDAATAWPELSGLPYLRSHADPYCVRRDRAAWHTEVPLAQLAAIAQSQGWHLPADIRSARVAERSRSLRALRIEFAGVHGERAVVSAGALRLAIGRALGWNRVRSDAYEIGISGNALVFDGHGFGHGVGLCQQGAAEMAADGRNAREILAFYFPGTVVRISPGDQGWQETQAGQLTIRATQLLPTNRMAALVQGWRQAQSLFPPRRPVAPQITMAPSTELFRQLTAQPGWELASTRGNIVVLQPDSVLRAQGRDPTQVLLHEFLHVLVEDEAGAHAPLWLREGLVEVLAGDSHAASPRLSADAIESMLMHPASQQESQNAHQAAAARVRILIDRYGVSAVRGWLSSGVPALAE